MSAAAPDPQHHLVLVRTGSRPGSGPHERHHRIQLRRQLEQAQQPDAENEDNGPVLQGLRMLQQS